jgi:hypothetical protein
LGGSATWKRDPVTPITSVTGTGVPSTVRSKVSSTLSPGAFTTATWKTTLPGFVTSTSMSAETVRTICLSVM